MYEFANGVPTKKHMKPHDYFLLIGAAIAILGGICVLFGNYLKTQADAAKERAAIEREIDHKAEVRRLNDEAKERDRKQTQSQEQLLQVYTGAVNLKAEYEKRIEILKSADDKHAALQEVEKRSIPELVSEKTIQEAFEGAPEVVAAVLEKRRHLEGEENAAIKRAIEVNAVVSKKFAPLFDVIEAGARRVCASGYFQIKDVRRSSMSERLLFTVGEGTRGQANGFGGSMEIEFATGEKLGVTVIRGWVPSPAELGNFQFDRRDSDGIQYPRIAIGGITRQRNGAGGATILYYGSTDTFEVDGSARIKALNQMPHSDSTTLVMNAVVLALAELREVVILENAPDSQKSPTK